MNNRNTCIHLHLIHHSVYLCCIISKYYQSVRFSLSEIALRLEESYKAVQGAVAVLKRGGVIAVSYERSNEIAKRNSAF